MSIEVEIQKKIDGYRDEVERIRSYHSYHGWTRTADYYRDMVEMNKKQLLMNDLQWVLSLMQSKIIKTCDEVKEGYIAKLS